MRRHYWFIIIIVLFMVPVTIFLVRGLKPPKPVTPTRNPDVVLITIDALRQDYLGCYGSERHLTPRLDKFATQAVRFEDPVTAAPLTTAGLASIQTGRLPIQHRLRTDAYGRLNSTELTLGEFFSAAGYSTAAFLSSRLPLDTNLTQGYDSLSVPVSNELPADEVVTNAIKWIGSHQDTPNFIWIHFSHPRGPWQAPYPWGMRHLDNPYAAEVAAIDDTFGKLLDGLSAIDGLAHSHIIVLSPTGEANDDEGEIEHGILLGEATISVPWLWRFPGEETAKSVPGLVATTDLMPTLMDALSLQRTRSAPVLEGISLLESIETETPSGRQRLLVETIMPRGYGWAPLFGLRKSRWKLVNGSHSYLYNLMEEVTTPQVECAETSEITVALRQELGAEIANISPEERDAVNWTNWGLGQPNPYNQVKISSALVRACRALQLTDPVTARYAASNLALRFPNNPRIVTLSALIHAAHGELDTAESEFHQVLDQLPNAVEARLGLSECLLEQNRLSEALEMLGKMSPPFDGAIWLLVEDPDFSFRLARTRGLILARSGNIPGAIDAFAKASARANRQSQRNKTGRLHQAARFLNDVDQRENYMHTSERPQVVRAALQLGTPQFARDLLRFTNSEEQTNGTDINDTPDRDPLSLLLDAREAVINYQFTWATRLVEDAIDAGVATASDCLALADAMELQGHRSEATAILLQGLPAFPKSAEIHFQLARLLTGKRRQENQALIHLETALELGFNDWERLAASSMRRMCQSERIKRFWSEIG